MFGVRLQRVSDSLPSPLLHFLPSLSPQEVYEWARRIRWNNRCIKHFPFFFVSYKLSLLSPPFPIPFRWSPLSLFPSHSLDESAAHKESHFGGFRHNKRRRLFEEKGSSWEERERGIQRCYPAEIINWTSFWATKFHQLKLKNI